MAESTGGATKSGAEAKKIEQINKIKGLEKEVGSLLGRVTRLEKLVEDITANVVYDIVKTISEFSYQDSIEASKKYDVVPKDFRSAKQTLLGLLEAVKETVSEDNSQS
jgi:hypothetical protein